MLYSSSGGSADVRRPRPRAAKFLRPRRLSTYNSAWVSDLSAWKQNELDCVHVSNMSVHAHGQKSTLWLVLKCAEHRKWCLLGPWGLYFGHPRSTAVSALSAWCNLVIRSVRAHRPRTARHFCVDVSRKWFIHKSVRSHLHAVEIQREHRTQQVQHCKGAGLHKVYTLGLYYPNKQLALQNRNDWNEQWEYTHRVNEGTKREGLT